MRRREVYLSHLIHDHSRVHLEQERVLQHVREGAKDMQEQEDHRRPAKEGRVQGEEEGEETRKVNIAIHTLQGGVKVVEEDSALVVCVTLQMVAPATSSFAESITMTNTTKERLLRIAPACCISS